MPWEGWSGALICYVAGPEERMDHFLYRDGQLHAEDVPLSTIADAVGTPVYVYSSATLLRHFRLFDEAVDGLDHLVCFAMKSLSNMAVLKLLAGAGAGMDVVSGGEYARARAAGVPGERIVFSGVGKTAEEIKAEVTMADYKDWGGYNNWRVLNVEGMIRHMTNYRKGN